ncbi:hypothetical protein MYA_4621 [Burkholderia sp. KJ006]|nr:hypothetical protein MYA_4621 [Burkholderia sp. KJ006]
MLCRWVAHVAIHVAIRSRGASAFEGAPAVEDAPAADRPSARHRCVAAARRDSRPLAQW